MKSKNAIFKKILLGLTFLVVLSLLSVKTGSIAITDREIPSVYDNFLKEAFHIISIIESNKQANAFNKHSKAHGIVQIRKICIKDINRIYNTNFTKQDAYCIDKSFDMFRLYVTAYCKNLSIYEIARVWNNGPSGRLSKHYAKKIDTHKGSYIDTIGKLLTPIKHESQL